MILIHLRSGSCTLIPLYRRYRNAKWLPLFFCLLWMSYHHCSAMVAYPGLWTGRQPDGSNTGEDFILIGTAEYHYVVVETDDTNYPIVRGIQQVDDDYELMNRGKDDEWLYFATMGSDGRYISTNLLVGQIQPNQPQFQQLLIPALKEKRHTVHNQCLRSEYCRWKQKLQQTATSHEHDNTISHTSGKVANVVIPFRFSNHANDTQRFVTPISDLDQLLFNGPQYSVRDYFSQQSYGTLEIISEIVPWVTIPYTEYECSRGRSGLSIIFHTCLEAALQQAMELLGDNLGNVLKSSTTTLTFVHSGYAAEFGGNDVDGVWYADRIWSHAWEIDTTHYFGRYAIISDKYDRTNHQINRVGVAVHVLAQVLGAPTLHHMYPGFGLGYFDVMANPWGFDGTLVNCGSMSPYTKNLFGWIQMEEILTDGSYHLEQSYSSNKVYVIKRGFPQGEYLILENRQEEGYDQGLSQPGLAIYHVDEKASNLASYPGQYNFPLDHYRVSLLQGDGRYDLERMEEEGDSGDLFHAGRFTGIGPDGVFLQDASLAEYQYPNTNSYQDGQETSSGVTISAVSVPDKVMSFQVSFSVR